MIGAGGVWPSPEDYQNAVLQPKRNLKDPRLQAAQVEMTNLGVLRVPFPRSGNFGAVYKFVDHGRSYALKVFAKSQPDRQQRYQMIDQHLAAQAASPNLVSFHYQPEGILVSGRWYPSLVMDWVEGELLDHHLAAALQRPGGLDNRSLCQAWIDLMLGLAARRLAHGDLQHGNILVLPDGTLKLVDYDGMFVPAMRPAAMTAPEVGLKAYQHPKRYWSYFDERLDNFAGLVILLSLACLDPNRWQRYHTDDDCLVVRESDLLRPAQSPLLNELLQSRDAPLRKLAVILRAAAQGGLDNIPAFADVAADSTVRQLLAPGWRPTLGPAITVPKPPPAPPTPADLTPRQREVLALVVQNHTNEQVAQQLSVTTRTVTDHISAIQHKAGVFTRRDLIGWATGNGFGPPRRPPDPPRKAAPPVVAVPPPPSPVRPTPPVKPVPAGPVTPVGPARADPPPGSTAAPKTNSSCVSSLVITALVIGLLVVCGVGAPALLAAFGPALNVLNGRGATATVSARWTAEAATAEASTIEAQLTQDALTALAPPTVTPGIGSSAGATQIRSVRLEHNLQGSDGTYYLAIHTEFQVNTADSRQVWVIARFWLSDGSPMPAASSTYGIGAQAAVSKVADITIEPMSYWQDYPLYMPYSALSVGQNEYATVEIMDVASTRILAQTTTEAFNRNP